MADLRGFDANTVEPTAPMDPIPAGKYLAMITDSAMKPNKSGTGQFLELVFTITEGPFQHRVLWAKLNLIHPHPVASRLAQADLSAVCRAVGVMTPNDSVELHNLPLVIKVRCRKRKDNPDEIVNDICGYERREAITGKPQQAQTSTAPWRRPS